jgi:predicted transcriptional regulator
MVALNPNELTLLCIINEKGPLNTETIAQIVYQPEEFVQKYLSSLEDKGLIDYRQDLYQIHDFAEK